MATKNTSTTIDRTRVLISGSRASMARAKVRVEDSAVLIARSRYLFDIDIDGTINAKGATGAHGPV